MIYLASFLGLILIASCNSPENSDNQLVEKPNVIFILTDDQGYCDLGCHGNPWIKTPNLDHLYNESVRFTDFHVGTTCAPTRAGLLTGQDCNKVGVWHTIKGRSILDPARPTIQEVFKQAGYATGIFGKWHLGDNYPYRPQDRGFDEVLIHKGGGVGQAPDYWNNDYFDDTYFHNGKPEKFEGYCTDIWFDNAMKFIKGHKDKPFFCYIPTNAPHGPFRVDEKYFAPYEQNDSVPSPVFYGMISNIDENVGRLRRFIEGEGLSENTILVFMTDNGTDRGVVLNSDKRVVGGYNAGMSGKKGSTYEGGHRVPFFLHWKKGGLETGKDINVLSSYVDFMPTLLDLCKVEKPENLTFEGVSLLPLVYDPTESWPERILFTDTQREEYLVKYKDFCVMTQKWRLLNDRLYDIEKDPGQFNDVAADNPDVVQKLKNAYETWWSEASVNKDEIYPILLGASETSSVTLSTHDCHGEGYPVWSQKMVRAANGANGHWVVKVVEDGEYQFDLRRWPLESGLKIKASAPEGEPVPGDVPYLKGEALNINKASIKIGDQEFWKNVSDTAQYSRFKIELVKGTYELECRFTDEENVDRDAYYVYVNRGL